MTDDMKPNAAARARRPWSPEMTRGMHLSAADVELMESGREEAYLEWPIEKRQQYHLVYTRLFAALIGFHRDCNLPTCRRARWCRGTTTKEQLAKGGYHPSFPPCTNGDENRRQDIIKALCARSPPAR